MQFIGLLIYNKAYTHEVLAYFETGIVNRLREEHVQQLEIF